MGGGIDRGRLALRASADGSLAPVAVLFPPMLADGDGDSASPGVVPLALETAVGTPAPSGPFHCQLLHAAGRDVLEGAGLSRRTRRQRSLICSRVGTHPIIRPGEALQFVITGNRTPGATVYVSLYYGQLQPSGHDHEEQVH